MAQTQTLGTSYRIIFKVSHQEETDPGRVSRKLNPDSGHRNVSPGEELEG